MQQSTPNLLGVFQTRPVLTQIQKLSAIDYFDGILYLGDEKGNLYRFTVNIKDIQIIPDAEKKNL